MHAMNMSERVGNCLDLKVSRIAVLSRPRNAFDVS